MPRLLFSLSLFALSLFALLSRLTRLLTLSPLLTGTLLLFAVLRFARWIALSGS